MEEEDGRRKKQQQKLAYWKHVKQTQLLAVNESLDGLDDFLRQIL
ncbi:hypothetical protein ACQP3J_31635 [Escherichia coli]